MSAEANSTKSRNAGMPTDIGIIDLMIGFPFTDKAAVYEKSVKGLKDAGSTQQLAVEQQVDGWPRAPVADETVDLDQPSHDALAWGAHGLMKGRRGEPFGQEASEDRVVGARSGDDDVSDRRRQHRPRHRLLGAGRAVGGLEQ